MMKKTSCVLFLFLMVVSIFLVGCNGNPFAGSHVVSFDPNNGDESIDILVKDGWKATAPSMTYNEDGMPFMEWRTHDGRVFDLETPISSDIGLKAAYYQKMTPEADFESHCIGWISSGFYWGVYNHQTDLIDKKELLKPVDLDTNPVEERGGDKAGLYEGENISEIEYVLSDLENLSAIQHVLGTLFIANGTKDEMTVEYSPYWSETVKVFTMNIGGTTYAFALDMDPFIDRDADFLAAIEKNGWKPFTDLEGKTTYKGSVEKLSFYVSGYGELYDSKEVLGMEGLNLKIHVKPNDETFNYEVDVDLLISETQLRIDNAHYEYGMAYKLCLDDEWKSPVEAKTYSFLDNRYRYEMFYQHFYDVENVTYVT